MSDKIRRRGFTLIELLVVVAIIGILAAALLVSLGSARSASRDARRIGDLRNVQAALELYYNKCQHYPGDPTCPLTASSFPVSANAWTGTPSLRNSLVNANLGINALPNDPTPNRNYYYFLQFSPLPVAQRYILAAQLEADNAALDTSIGSLTNPAPPTGSTVWVGPTAAGNPHPFVACDPNPQSGPADTIFFVYCVGI